MERFLKNSNILYSTNGKDLSYEQILDVLDKNGYDDCMLDIIIKNSTPFSWEHKGNWIRMHITKSHNNLYNYELDMY